MSVTPLRPKTPERPPESPPEPSPDLLARFRLDGAALSQDVRAALGALEAEADALRARAERAEHMADRDALTPILNRRAFVRELKRQVAYCRRYGAQAALVYLDLDRFKAVNDAYGHAGGDAVLEHVAATLLAHVRESDVVGRLGGDEFAVLLVQADRAAAETKAQALIEALHAAPARLGGHEIPVRASYGVRSLEPGLDAASLMAEADAAMFVRKASSRV